MEKEASPQKRQRVVEMAEVGYTRRCISTTLDLVPSLVAQILKKSGVRQQAHYQSKVSRHHRTLTRRQEKRVSRALQGGWSPVERGVSSVTTPLASCRDETGKVDPMFVRGRLTTPEWLEGMTWAQARDADRVAVAHP